MCFGCFSASRFGINAGFLFEKYQKNNSMQKISKRARSFALGQEKKITKKGFSLIEILVAVFIFTLTMVLLTGTFSGFLKNYATEKRLQRDIENAQHSINIMAKSIRESAVVSTASFPLNTYNYAEDKCVQYRFNSNKIQLGTIVPTTSGDPSSCVFGSIPAASFVDVTSDSIVNASINATATSSSGEYGRVTIALYFKDSGSATVGFPIQMSISLRQ